MHLLLYLPIKDNTAFHRCLSQRFKTRHTKHTGHSFRSVFYIYTFVKCFYEVRILEFHSTAHVLRVNCGLILFTLFTSLSLIYLKMFANFRADPGGVFVLPKVASQLLNWLDRAASRFTGFCDRFL